MLKAIKKNKNKFLVVILLTSFIILFSTSLSFVYGEPSIEIKGNLYLSETLNISMTGIDGNSTYQWSSSSDGVVFNDIEGATKNTYKITQNEINKYIKVTITNSVGTFSKKTDDVVKIAFYLDKGSITISSNTGYSGYDKNGNAITGTHSDDNKYVVTQTDSSVANANRISLDGILNNCDITLDGINTSVKNSIYIPAYKGVEKNVVLRLKGTNTVNNVIYHTSNTYNASDLSLFAASTLKITSADGDGSINGKLNVAPVDSSARWGAGIGGLDDKDAVTGLTIAGGTFNVITDRIDDCTAIGAGGNGYVDMKITGGKIYAENASTGATIGGGLGYDGVGGGGIVEITGGEIEAINHGNNYYNTDVWGVAIGGGGSRGGQALDVEVIISGGKIKATVPNGATVIGAGNSTLSYGGKATINISGGEITATGNIGGGSVMGDNTHNGGLSIVNISGGFISVDGNIGGGAATQGNGGTSTVNISGGTIVSNSIGGGYSIKNGYNSSSLTITGGSLNSEVSSTPTNGTENVYLTPITFYNTNDYYKKSLIKSIKGLNYYGMKDVKTDVNGKAYFWIPNTSVIESAIDSNNDVYLGTVPSKSNGILKYNTSMDLYTVNLSQDPKYYDLYLDKDLTNKYTGTVYKVDNSTFNFYVDKKIDINGNNYHIDVYASNSKGVMKMITPKSTNNNIDEYEIKISTNNIEVWFIVTDGDNKVLKLDLNSGNIVLTKNSNTNNIDVTVGKYNLLNYNGIFTLTSQGLSSSNHLRLVSGKANILVSNLIAYGNESIINADSGTLILKSDNHDNQITSTNASAITVRDGANVNIIMENGNSLKLNSLTNSTISGNGSINLTKNSGAHLELSKNDSFSQVVANEYTYTTNSLNDSTLPYSLSLSNLIGYHNSIDNRLYDLNKKYTVSETTTFKATSLTTTLNDLTETHEIDDNGNLVITLDSKPVSMVVLRNGEVMDSKTWLNDNILTIPASEAYYNLSIVATKYLTYNFVATGYNDFYDGKAHNVNVDVTNISNVDVYYSTFQLDSSNYNTVGSTTSPELTNVGSLPVYFYIPQATYNENVYKEASGVLNIIINKADNRWDLAVGIPNIVKGMTLQPHSKARWGEPVYSYYKYTDGEYIETTPMEAGIYFIKAFVEGTDNYNALESNYIKFDIVSTTLVKAEKGRHLTKVTEESKDIEISNNEVLSAYFAFRYTPNVYDDVIFKFNQNLPANTKITLIDFNSSTPTYYKYNDNNALSSIALKNLIKMGTTDTHLIPPTSGGEIVAEYQLILDFSETTNNLSQLNSIIYQGANQIQGTEFNVTFSGNSDKSISLGDITNERGKMSVPISVKSNDTYIKTLDIELTDESDNDIMLPIYISAELLDEEGTRYFGFIRKNHIFMTIDKKVINEKFTLILDNLTTDSYKINVKMYENNSYASAYKTTEITGRNKNSVYVKDLVLSKRFIDNNSTVTFNVNYTTESENEILVYRSLKQNGVYNSKELVDRIILPSLKGELDIPVTVNQASGVWRYYFELGDSTDVYNIIVK